MEEKERYKWSQDVIVECAYEDYDCIVDTENNIIFNDDNYFKLVDLLNQQYKEIEDLKYKVHLLNEQSQNNYEKYVQVLKDNNLLNERIKELETCLDEEIESNVNLYNLQLKTEQENQQLKQQLDEKEKEIESLRTRQFIDMTEKEMLELKIATHNQDLKQIKHINQSQNQKAIEQLTEMKKFIYQELEYMWNSNAELTCIDRAIIDSIYKKIDNQVNELNGDVEE